LWFPDPARRRAAQGVRRVHQRVRPRRRQGRLPRPRLWRALRGTHTPITERTGRPGHRGVRTSDRKSTRLNSSHVSISYAVFCLKKKKEHRTKILSMSYGEEYDTHDI